MNDEEIWKRLNNSFNYGGKLIKEIALSKESSEIKNMFYKNLNCITGINNNNVSGIDNNKFNSIAIVEDKDVPPNMIIIRANDPKNDIVYILYDKQIIVMNKPLINTMTDFLKTFNF